MGDDEEMRTDGSVPSTTKTYLLGTHRVLDPEETVRRIRRFMPVFGITRVADVTGLDAVDIPVVMAIRPNARSLSVSQGKGLTLASAEASGLMEAVELWHAEHTVLPLQLGSYDEVRLRQPCVDVTRMLFTSDTAFHAHLPLLWTAGTDLLDGSRKLVPFEAVHTDFRVGVQATGCFPRTSNGLASGNHPLEALSHALCELIERDATTLWDVLPADAQARTRLDLDTVDDASCREVVDRFRRAGLEVAAWDLSTDTRLPVFHVVVADVETQPYRHLGVAKGAGRHPSRRVALLRALTEAAQSRLTIIAGSQDDNLPSGYHQLRDPDDQRDRDLVLDRSAETRDFADVADFQNPDLESDVELELAALAGAGIDEVVSVDLTRREFGVPVVKAIAPGLEGHHLVENYAYGPRARRLMAPVT